MDTIGPAGDSRNGHELLALHEARDGPCTRVKDHRCGTRIDQGRLAHVASMNACRTWVNVPIVKNVGPLSYIGHMSGYRAMGEAASAGVIPEWTMGDRLRKARERASIGQVEFSQITGVARSSIVRYEGDVTAPRRHVLLVWAMATGVDMEWLETGKAPSHGGDGAKQQSLLRESNSRPFHYKRHASGLSLVA